MNATYRLGEAVTVTDFLVRVSLSADQAEHLAAEWPDFPGRVLTEARRRSESWRQRREFKAWVPASLQAKCGAPWRYLPPDYRHNPTRHYNDVTFPLAGIVVQKATLQDGMPDNDPEYGAGWISLAGRPAYHVAYDLRYRPLIVSPSMLAQAGVSR